MRDQVHHSVPFLNGQDDIPRSDDEEDSRSMSLPQQQAAPEPSQGGPDPPTPVDPLLISNTTTLDGTQPLASVLGPTAQITPVLANPELPIPEKPSTPTTIAGVGDDMGFNQRAAVNVEMVNNQFDETGMEDTNVPGRSNCDTTEEEHEPPAGPPLPVPIPIQNPSIHSLNNLEQRQNERRSRLALSKNVLLYGPSKRHAHGYVSDLYARTKPQIYTPNPKASNGPDNAKKYQGSFSIAEQLMMYPVEHSMLYDLICIDPFPVDDTTVTRGFAFAHSVISARLNGKDSSHASHSLRRFMMNKLSRKRNSMLALVQRGILDKYQLPSDVGFDDLDAYHRVIDLMQNDSFADLASDQPESTTKFTHPAIEFVLKSLFFKTKPSVGLLFMDRIASGDAEAPWHDTRSDTSLEALRGIPIGAIAFACILIKHVLFNYRQAIIDEPRANFEGKTYTTEWDRYHRKLVALVDLGRLRGQLFDTMKTLYFEKHPYDLNESMVQSDTIW
ncbi:unnamed protein product [Rhizoctonia solani]|uniref:DUF6532 domain-containing protein n=1 Tax=Rhizoctonia solani TaxID=456999 RepID=A0A8H3HNR0_9AGAM|nr:unnamed protein product [Rhizoctonia solani]